MTAPEPMPATLSWGHGAAAAVAIMLGSAVTYPVMASAWVFGNVVGLWCTGVMFCIAGWLLRKRVTQWLPRLFVTTIAAVAVLLSLFFTLITIGFALTDF